MSKDLDILQVLEQSNNADLHYNSSSEDFPIIGFTPDFDEYERIVVFHSTGKDSSASLLHLLDLGVERSKIELHHHRIDGDSDENFMDWPCTDSYMKAYAKAFDLPLYFSWRDGGFKGELLRENCGTKPVVFTRGDGSIVSMGGERSKDSTRRKFPQVSASLITRWCSSSLKIDVGSRLLVNDERFTKGKTLVITGERAEESANRARYASFEPHRCDNRNGRIPRWIDHWRPVHSWSERQVWKIIERHKVNPFPSYFVGTGRASCMMCIFSSQNQWATMRKIALDRFNEIAGLETEFGVTIHRTRSVVEQADRGTPYQTDDFWVKVAMSKEYTLPIFVDTWVLPAGAYGESNGPS